MDEFDVGFDESDCVFNVVSKAILPAQAAFEMLNHAKIGKERYDEFVKERLHGSLSIWAPMRKRMLQSFKTTKSSINTKVGAKVVQLKEEKTLLARFLIAARKRPDLDLEHCLGNFEFSVVPKALFTGDGQPLTCTDKSAIMHQIEKFVEPEELCEMMSNLSPGYRVIVIDGMAAVNQVNKTKEMLTCQVR